MRPKDKESKLATALAGSDLATTSFAELGLPDRLVDVLRQRGITRPLPIQAAAIADILAGRDVSGKAPTGSGKTLAFALPIAATLNRSAPKRPRGLVLAPTRELANQIAVEMGPLLRTRSLTAYPFYGGVGFGGQLQALRRGVDVAVACPGRLEDLVRSGEIELSNIEVAVVDEADRMADMGFLPAVRRILDATPSSRQTLLFSATLDGDVDVLVRRYQSNPVRHEVAVPEDVSLASHEFRAVASAGRTALCAELVLAPGSSVVFVRTKRGADRVARGLKNAGVSAAAIHGDRSQAQRERTLADFRAGRLQTLVATDVAARGIHVDDVARVIHYDLPEDIKDYVHRSGRTARAGAGGTVVAFVPPEKRGLAASLQTGLRLVDKRVAPLEYEDRGLPATPERRAQQPPVRGTRRHDHGFSRRRGAHQGQGGTAPTARAGDKVRQAGAGANRRRKPRGNNRDGVR